MVNHNPAPKALVAVAHAFGVTRAESARSGYQRQLRGRGSV